MATTIESLIVEMRANTANFDRGMQGVDSKLGKVSNAAKLATAAVAAIGGSQVLRQLGQLTKRGGEVENVMRALSNATGNADTAVAKLRRSTRGLISDYDLAVGLNRALTLGAAATTEQYGQLAETGIALGRALGVDAASAVESLSLGIGRQSKLILDNLGLIVSVEEANRAYARQLGKTVEQLTDAERREAFRNATLDAAREKIEQLGGSAENNADKIARMAAEFANLRDEIGRTLNASGALGRFFDSQALGVSAIGDFLQQRRLGLSQEGFGIFQSNAGLTDPRAIEAARRRLVNDFQSGSLKQDDFIALSRQLTELTQTLSASNGVTAQMNEVAAAAKETARALKDVGGIPKLDAAQVLKRLGERPDVIARTIPFSTRNGGGGIDVEAITTNDGGGSGFLDSAFGNIDPARMAESALGNLLSGGMSSLLNAATGLLGSALGSILRGGGPSDREMNAEAVREASQDMAQAARDNVQALVENTRALLGKGATGIASDELLKMIRRVSESLEFGTFRDGQGGEFARFFDASTREQGLLDEVRNIAEQFGVSLTEIGLRVAGQDATGIPLSEIEALLASIRASLDVFDGFAGRMDLLNRQLDAQDIDGALERFEAQRDLLADILGEVGSPLEDFVDSLSAENIGQALQEMLDMVSESPEQLARMLADSGLSISEFIDFLTNAETSLDDLADAAADVSRALRNVPSGFKVALAEFRATQTGGGGGGGGTMVLDNPLVRDDPYFDKGDKVFNITINAQGANAEQVYDVFERELARKVRRGGTPRTSLYA